MHRVVGLLLALVLFQTTAGAVVRQEDCAPGEQGDCTHSRCGPFCTHCACCAQVGSVTLVSPAIATTPQRAVVDAIPDVRAPLTGFRANILHVPR
jgi:hypothetical protein